MLAIDKVRVAAQVLVSWQLQRFCQQCCCFHTLSAFDGSRRCSDGFAVHMLC